MTTTTTTAKNNNRRRVTNRPPVRDRVIALRDELQKAFPERDQIINGLVFATLADEHVALVGPPGTAKSLLCRVFARALGGRFWDYLMTRYSEPNEIFGPIDLQAWSNKGTYGRRTAGFFPEAEFVFLDEIFKANSSILNSLLTAINERILFDDGKSTRIPLRTVVAASNELPEGVELEALFDRFLLRYEVNYVSDPNSFAAIVDGPEPTVSTQLTLAELDEARKDAQALPLAGGLVDGLFALRSALQQEGFAVSDRRWKKLISILRAVAYMEGDSEVDVLHFDVLQHGLWREPKDRQKIASIVAKSASPALADALEINDEIMEMVQGLPQAGDVGAPGRSVVSEVKKAVKRLEGLQSDTGGAVAKRIEVLAVQMKEVHATLTQRIMDEMDLGL